MVDSQNQLKRIQDIKNPWQAFYLIAREVFVGALFLVFMYGIFTIFNEMLSLDDERIKLETDVRKELILKLLDKCEWRKQAYD